MGEMTITQELRAAEGGLAAAKVAREAAELAFEAAKERREAAEARSPILAAGGYGNASEWRAALDETNFAHHQEAQFAEALAGAQASEEDWRGRLRTAERRNLIASRTAALEKVARLGADIVRQMERLKDLDRQIVGRGAGQMTVDLAGKFVGVLGHRLKLVGLRGSLPSDPGGRDWAGFVAWGESLLRGGVVPDGRPSARMVEAEALDRLPDPVEVAPADVAEAVPAPLPVAAGVAVHDYSVLPPVESD